MGAEIIHQETHNHPDMYRLVQSTDRESVENGPYFHVINRNHLSVALNLADVRARDLAKRIIKISDVFVENNSPRLLKGWGLDYDHVKGINPSIIMASISGYGQTGPLANQASYGTGLIQASGLSALFGYEGQDPIGSISSYPDPVTGIGSFFAIMTALFHRNRTGKGQYIDISLIESTVALMGAEVVDYTMNGRIAKPTGNRSPWFAPHGFYRCKGPDKWISISCPTENEWKALCVSTGKLEWLNDNRFTDNFSRLKNQEALDGLITKWTEERSDYEAMEVLQRAGVAAVPVFTMAEMFTDPHVQDEEYVTPLPHPNNPACFVYNTPWKLSQTPGKPYRAAPLLGEHSEYVLCDLCGLPKDEFARLCEERVIW
jgi:benzylsuccinate CoA-transferase BbsF subunit